MTKNDGTRMTLPPTPTSPWDTYRATRSLIAPPASMFAWVTCVVGAAGLACSFLPFYVVTTTITPIDTSYTAQFTINGWYGLFGWLSAVLMALAAVAAVIHLVVAKARIAAAIISLILGLLALASGVATWAIYPPIAHLDIIAGHDWFSIDKAYTTGFWLLLICAILTAGAAVLVFADARMKARVPSEPATRQMYAPAASWASTQMPSRISY